MGRITTHVLDTAAGRPAAGLKVVLTRLEGTPEAIAVGVTNQDGRLDRPLLEGAAFATGRYEIMFHVGDYFRNSGIALRFQIGHAWPAVPEQRRSTSTR